MDAFERLRSVVEDLIEQRDEARAKAQELLDILKSYGCELPQTILPWENEDHT